MLEIEICSLIAHSGLFDADYYLRKNPDVALSGLDPLLHYVRYGEAEGRNPSAEFDLALYKPVYGENVLLEYIRALENS